MNEKERKEKKVTPVGEAKWAYLHEPKPAFEGKGQPKYTIDVYFDPDNPEWAGWIADVKRQLEALPQQIDKRTGVSIPKKLPIKRELNQFDQPTGRLYVSFKTSDKFQPPVFDRYGKSISQTTRIGNGSKVRISYIENEYSAFGGGINFYLNAVQVIELVEFQSRTASAYGFEVEEIPEDYDTEPF